MARSPVPGLDAALRQDHPEHPGRGIPRRRVLRPQRPHHLDFSQLFGDPRAVLDSDDFVAYAVTVLSGFRATQHISANHVITIDGDRARALAAMSAWHRADMDPGVVDTFMLRGRYDIGMVRAGDSWRMDKLHMTVWDEDGNKAVFQAARQAWEARVATPARSS